MDINVLLFFISIPFAASDCNWPSNLQRSVWHDSDKGELNFDSKTMSGLDYVVSGTPIDTWDCLYNFDTTGILIMKSQSTIELFSTVYRPYQCIVLTTITEHSYTYYIHAVQEIRVGNERLNLREELSTAVITENNAVESLCNSSTITANEYHVLVKDGWESNARQDCPSELIYEFYYSVNDGSTISCGTQAENWNVCDAANKIQFNYTLCSSEIAYSTSGVVYCLTTVTSGNYTITTVMNEDSGSTYTFSCFMYEASSNGTIYLSQSPMSCTSSQTPTTIPEHPDGTQGLLLELTPYQTSECDPTTTSTTTTSTTTTSTTSTTTTSTTTTTPTTTTTTPTTTTTTPTTTTTTSTTTTTTPTTTTTTPTTTTTTPTTTTTTPTTTTTTPTTTTTTPTTTTTTPTTTTTQTTTTPTTTTTTPTTTTSTTTTPSQATTTEAPDNTLTIIAATLGGLAVLLILTLIIAFIAYRCCKRPRPVSPSPVPEKVITPEPDVIIDALPHKMSGLSAMTPRHLQGPRETSMLEGLRPRTSLLVFPDAKHNNFKLTMTNTTQHTDNKLKHGYSQNQRIGSTSVTKHGVEHLKFPVPSPIREETLHSLRAKEVNNEHNNSLETQSTTIPNYIPTPRHDPRVHLANNIQNTTLELEKELNHLDKSSNDQLNTTTQSIRSQMDLSGKPSGTSVIMTQMNPDVAKQETLARTESRITDPGSPELNSTGTENTSVEVPQTARPVLISPELEQRVNMKSRIAFEEKATPRRSADLDMTNVNHNKTISDDQQNIRSPEHIMTSPGPALFTNIDLVHVNASKESHDLVITNTPLSNLASGRTSINDVSLPEIPSPSVGKDFEGRIPSPKFRSSPVIETRSPSETAKLYANVELM